VNTVQNGTHSSVVFEARGLTKTYDMGEVYMLCGVDLELYPANW
jgi:hypothetical protein